MFIFVCDVHVLCESSRLQKPSKLPQKASKRLQKPSNAYKSQKLGHFVFNVFGNMQKNGNFKPSAFFFAEFSRNYVFGRSMVMIASLNTVRVCAHHHADWDARLIL